MPSDISGEVPPWLSRNWSPREPFDPTPWLQERYRRQVQQAKLPLELQQMELQNAAAKLGIEHQGMVNELQGMQLQKYNEELPLFQQALNDTGGDPAKILNRVESFQSPLLQNQWNSLQLQAGKTIKGIALQQNVIRKFQAAARLEGLGAPPVALDENGMIDDESLKASADAYNAQRIAEIQARNEGRVNAMSGMSSPERRANALKRARQDLVDAVQTGDDARIEEAQTFLDDLQRAISLEHKDPVEQTQLNLIRQTINQIDKDLGNLVLKDKWPELRTRRKELQSQLDNWGKNKPATPATEPSAEPAATEPPKKVGEFKILRTIK